MHFETYDYATGDLIDSSASILDFGDVIQGQHCTVPVLVRAAKDIENTITDSTVFLESKGGWNQAQFGYYINQTFQPFIESGSSELDNHFIETPGAITGSSNGVQLPWDSEKSHYLWLDIDISFNKGTTQANYRLIFNFT